MADMGFVAFGAYIFGGLRGYFVDALRQGRFVFHKSTAMLGALGSWAAAMVDECHQVGAARGSHFDPIDATCFTVSLVVLAIAYRLDPHDTWTM